MPPLAVAFLGVIALAAVVQCALVIVVALSVRDTGARVTDLCRRFDSELRPALNDLRLGAANLRAVSETARDQAARAEALISTTLSNLESTIESVRTVVLRPLASISELTAFWGGVKQGIDSYRQSTPQRRTGPVPRRGEDGDEHLFIG